MNGFLGTKTKGTELFSAALVPNYLECGTGPIMCTATGSAQQCTNCAHMFAPELLQAARINVCIICTHFLKKCCTQCTVMHALCMHYCDRTAPGSVR